MKKYTLSQHSPFLGHPFAASILGLFAALVVQPMHSALADVKSECLYREVYVEKTEAVGNPADQQVLIHVTAKSVQTVTGTCEADPAPILVKGRKLKSVMEKHLNTPGATFRQTMQTGGNRDDQVMLPAGGQRRSGSNITGWGGFLSFFFISNSGVAQQGYRSRVSVYREDGRNFHLDYDNVDSHDVAMSCLEHPATVANINDAGTLTCSLTR